RENGAVPVGAVEVEIHTGGNLVSGEVVHTDTGTGRDDDLVQKRPPRQVVDDQVLVVGRHMEENSVPLFGAFGHRNGQGRKVTGGNLTADQTLFDRVHGLGLLSVDELLGENVVVYTLPKDRGRILHPHLPPDPHSGRGVPPPVLEDRCFIDGLGPALNVTGEVVKRDIRKASRP